MKLIVIILVEESDRMEKKFNNIYFEDYGNLEIVKGITNHLFPIHTHRFLCVGIITKGKVIFICEGVKIILKAGSEYIIPPNCSHAFNPISDKPYSYLTLCFKNKTFNFSLNMTEYIAKALYNIENTVTNDLSIDDICKAINISKFHFIRQFKIEVGMTPYKFFLNSKIKKIRQGIILEQQLSDLALELGFSDQSHMSNIFKRYMGVSPLQFHKKYNAH